MTEITPEPRRIRSFFIKDILEHRNPSTTEENENPTTQRSLNEQSPQTTSTSYTVQHILGTNGERTVDPCNTGKKNDLDIVNLLKKEMPV